MKPEYQYDRESKLFAYEGSGRGRERERHQQSSQEINACSAFSQVLEALLLPPTFKNHLCNHFRGFPHKWNIYFVGTLRGDSNRPIPQIWASDDVLRLSSAQWGVKNPSWLRKVETHWKWGMNERGKFHCDYKNSLDEIQHLQKEWEGENTHRWNTTPLEWIKEKIHGDQEYLIYSDSRLNEEEGKIVHWDKESWKTTTEVCWKIYTEPLITYSTSYIIICNYLFNCSLFALKHG